jgi:alkanesulfonate monooxygenase SsuD/methylene tetrahydromethanopterin reductase-like flavin-dependent oxidoreductase (luciferase family)
MAGWCFRSVWGRSTIPASDEWARSWIAGAARSRLDESLEILVGLWSGAPFGFEGRHYRFEPMAFRPPPVQRPRIPIWVVGAWPSDRSMRRVVRYDGVLPNFLTSSGGIAQATPLDALRAMRDWLDERTGDRRLDIVVEGTTPGDDPSAAAAQVRPLAEAGATWRIESDWSTWDASAMRRRIEAGLPAIDLVEEA